MGPYCVLATVPVSVRVPPDADDDGDADARCDEDVPFPAPSALPGWYPLVDPAALLGPAASVGVGAAAGVVAAEASATGWDLNASSAASPAAVLPMVMMARRMEPPRGSAGGWAGAGQKS